MTPALRTRGKDYCTRLMKIGLARQLHGVGAHSVKVATPVKYFKVNLSFGWSKGKLCDKSYFHDRFERNGKMPADQKMTDLLLSDTSPLRLSDSVGVIIRTENNRYLFQHRSNQKGLYFPGFWGLFGGGIKPAESPEQAARRELREEIGLDISEIELVMQFQFNFRPLDLKTIARWFFLIHLTRVDVENIRLSEGVDVKAFSAKYALTRLRLVHYDAFALWALESRDRLT